MNNLNDQLMVLVILINIFILGTHRTQVAIRAIAVQGGILGLLPLLAHSFSGRIMIVTLIVFFAKCFFIPRMLLNALKKVGFTEDLQPFFGYSGNVITGAFATLIAFVWSTHLPLAPAHQGLLTLPASLAAFLCGFIALASRRKAINQVVGYLMLENGIFIFGTLLTEAMPLMVEAGAILDLIAGIFVMGIIINHISREFSSIDTSRMTALREVE